MIASLFNHDLILPLKKVEDKLVYENISFKGPDASDASEEIEVELMSSTKNLLVPASFYTSDQKKYNKTGRCQDRWNLVFADQPLAPNSFSFEGSSYYLENYRPSLTDMDFSNIYLDINASWTNEEISAVYELVKNKRVAVWNNEMKIITEDNKHSLWKAMKGLQFSLFPFHKVSNPTQALVITKNVDQSPNLENIKGTGFYDELTIGLT